MTQTADQYEKAAKRHFEDARYLESDQRWANASYHYGFTVECALKSLTLRFGVASFVATKSGARRTMPSITGVSGEQVQLSHLPGLWTNLSLHLQGRSGSRLSAVLCASTPFANWSVDNRYLDGAAITAIIVRDHAVAATNILRLHDAAKLAGGL